MGTEYAVVVQYSDEPSLGENKSGPVKERSEFRVQYAKSFQAAFALLDGLDNRLFDKHAATEQGQGQYIHSASIIERQLPTGTALGPPAPSADANKIINPFEGSEVLLIKWALSGLEDIGIPGGIYMKLTHEKLSIKEFTRQTGMIIGDDQLKGTRRDNILVVQLPPVRPALKRAQVKTPRLRKWLNKISGRKLAL